MILITGGLGYVGGRVAQYLAQSGYSLRLTSRCETKQKPQWLENGEITRWNAEDKTDLTEMCDGVDAVIHFAALNEIGCAHNPNAALEVNGMGTLRLLQAAQAANVRRFLYFSTAHIYGTPLVGRISESTLPRPIHPYAITHRVAEDFVLAARDQGKIEGIVLRLSNGFGAPISPEVNRWTLIVNDLCRQAVTTRKLVLHSSGTQLRDFIALHDVARCASHFVSLPSELCADGLFNLGGEYVCSIYGMTQLVASRCATVLGFTPPIERVQPHDGESSIAFEYDIAKLKFTGFSVQGYASEEIDATLMLCQQAFGLSDR